MCSWQEQDITGVDGPLVFLEDFLYPVKHIFIVIFSKNKMTLAQTQTVSEIWSAAL